LPPDAALWEQVAETVAPLDPKRKIAKAKPAEAEPQKG
jgi:hypothetical protein